MEGPEHPKEKKKKGIQNKMKDKKNATDGLEGGDFKNHEPQCFRKREVVNFI